MSPINRNVFNVSFYLLLLSRPTLQYYISCQESSESDRPPVSINSEMYRSLTAICEYGAGFECTSRGDVAAVNSATHNIRPIYTAYRAYCSNRCYCVPESGDDPQAYSEEDPDLEDYSDDDKENQPNLFNTRHTCSGTCTEVVRACSWAYTGECMCTADPIPDPWGLFTSHGCAAVIGSVSKLGGRDVAGLNNSQRTGEFNSSTAALVNTTNSIVKGSDGYYNATTGVQIPCPCNSTCVSYGCCGSDGMTFAPQDRCLGRLDVASA